jgi:hypothetical protein
MLPLHDLRHTCATLLLSRGHHPKLVQELLGHASAIVLEDLEGETVTIGFYSPASEFGEFDPEAQKVLESVEWRGS